MKHNFFSKFINYLSFGLKNAENKMFGENKDDSNIISVNQNIEDEKLSKSLINGEVTQEVKNLRYRTYKICNESKKYEYVGEGKAFKKKNIENVNVENSENYDIILVQNNIEYGKTISECLDDIDGSVSNEFLLKISYKNYPRYKLETFVNKIVLKLIDSTHHQIDLYCSSEPNTDNFISKSFVSELKRILEMKVRSDIMDIETIEFTTYNCSLQDDLVKYEYDNVFFRDITLYNNSFILKFKCHLKNEPIKLIEHYKEKEVDEKYLTKEKKDVIFNLSEIDNKEYTCEECGKKMSNRRFLVDGSDTEFFDAQITKETFGRFLCKDCLRKILEEKMDN